MQGLLETPGLTVAGHLVHGQVKEAPTLLACQRETSIVNIPSGIFDHLENASLGVCVPWSMHLLDDVSLTWRVPERCVPTLWDILTSCQDRVGRTRILQGTRRPRDAPSKGCIVHGIWNIKDFSFKDTSSLHHNWDTFTCQWRQNIACTIYKKHQITTENFLSRTVLWVFEWISDNWHLIWTP